MSCELQRSSVRLDGWHGNDGQFSRKGKDCCMCQQQHVLAFFNIRRHGDETLDYQSQTYPQ